MRKFIAASVIGLVALTGQAIAKQTVATTAPVAVRAGDRVSGQSAQANQLMGLGTIPTVIVVVAGITLIALIADTGDNNTNCYSSGC